MSFFRFFRGGAENGLGVGDGVDLQAKRGDVDRFVQQQVDGRCDVGIVVGNGSEGELFIERGFDLSVRFGEPEARADDHTAGSRRFERDIGGNVVVAAMHAGSGESPSRDAEDGVEHGFVCFDGVIDAALRRDLKPFLVVVDEDGYGLVVDEQLCDDIAEFSRAEDSDMGAFGDMESVDDRFARGDDPRKERFGIGDAGRKGGEIFLFGHDEVAHIPFGVDAGYLHVAAGIGVAREAAFAPAAGNGIVNEYARIFSTLMQAEPASPTTPTANLPGTKGYFGFGFPV